VACVPDLFEANVRFQALDDRVYSNLGLPFGYSSRAPSPSPPRIGSRRLVSLLLACRGLPPHSLTTFAPPDCAAGGKRHHGRDEPGVAGQAAGAGPRTRGGRHHTEGVGTLLPHISSRLLPLSHSHPPPRALTSRTATKSARQCSSRSTWGPTSQRNCSMTCADRAPPRARAQALAAHPSPPSLGQTHSRPSRRRTSNSPDPIRTMRVRRRAPWARRCTTPVPRRAPLAATRNTWHTHRAK